MRFFELIFLYDIIKLAMMVKLNEVVPTYAIKACSGVEL
jgi:hypothetical protein